jgi:hypothetical protein
MANNNNNNNNNIVSIDPLVRRAVAAIDINETEQELKVENLNVLDGNNAQYMVDFLHRQQQHPHSSNDARNKMVMVNKLYICCNQWSTQAVEVFRAFFVTTTLDKINLRRGRLGNENCGRLLSGLHGNNNMCGVSKLYLRYNIGLEGAAGGGHLAALLQHNTQLKELRCGSFALGAPGARAMQTSLCTNTSLQALLLRKCRLGDEGTAAIASALNDNHTIQVLSLENNHLTFHSLANVAQLLQHPSLQLLILDQNPELFANHENNNMTLFTDALSSPNNKLKILSMNQCRLPSHVLIALFSSAAARIIDDNDTTMTSSSLSELNAYDQDQVCGQTLMQLLEIIPKLSSSLRRLHVNFDFTNASVQASFHSNTGITHLYNRVNRTKITSHHLRQRHHHNNNSNNVEPLLRILKRNRKLHHANELLHDSSSSMPQTQNSSISNNSNVIPKGLWVMGLESLLAAHDDDNTTGITAVYKILRAKLVMWWAPKQVSK